MTAALSSIAVNGMGAALIAFGAHGASDRRRHIQTINIEPLPATAPTAHDHARQFVRSALRPADTNTPLARLLPAYVAWCQATGAEPLPKREIATELAALFEKIGVEIAEVDGERQIWRAKIEPGRVLSPMTTIGVNA